MSGEMPCMNCKQSVLSGKAKFFASVFLCESCEAQAVHFFNRLERELKYLLVVAKEAIRVALVEGRFSFPEGPQGEPSKKEVLEEIMRMVDRREEQLKEPACLPTTSATESQVQEISSGDSMPPHVKTLAALGRASSTKVSPQD